MKMNFLLLPLLALSLSCGSDDPIEVPAGPTTDTTTETTTETTTYALTNKAATAETKQLFQLLADCYGR